MKGNRKQKEPLSTSTLLYLGERHKVNVGIVHELKALYATGDYFYSDLRKHVMSKYGITISTKQVRNIVKGRAWCDA